MRQIEEKGAPKACACESCKRNKGQPHKIAFGTVRNYRAAPRGGWKGKKLTNEVDTYFLGVELETSAPLRPGRRSSWESLPFQDYCRPHNWTYGTDEMGDPDSQYSYVSDLARRGQNDTTVANYRNHVARCRVPRAARPDPTLGNNPATNEQAADMRRPKYHWVPKHDGSVTGPEFASQPATMAWWYAHKPQLDEMFTMLLHAGYRSHEGDKAGLHVNISTEAFGTNDTITPPDNTLALAAAYAEMRRLTRERDAANVAYSDAYTARTAGRSGWGTEREAPPRPLSERLLGDEFDRLRRETRTAYNNVRELERQGEPSSIRVGAEDHLRRFLDLIYVNKQWSRRMAQRTAESEQHWAKLDLLNDPNDRAQWVRSAVKRGRNEGGDRYIAVNRPDNMRYEFRLPRGTLRIDRFFKNLEWTHAMIEYTRDLAGDPLIECTPVKFMAWVLKGSDYPYLRAFITEKFTAQVARTATLKGAAA